MFFTADDVAKFARYKLSFDDAIKGGKLDPAYAMFALYKQRVAERSAYATGLLKQDIFDFDGDERWYYDREESPWATATELHQLSKQSVANDWLRLRPGCTAPAAIRTVFAKRYGYCAAPTDEPPSADAAPTGRTAYPAAPAPPASRLEPRSAARFNQAMSLSLEGI